MPDVSVLIADDSSTVRKLVRKSIESRLGFNNIHEAGDGAEAIKMLQAHEIDIVISDWEMPKQNGDELLLEMRGNAKWKEIPFIMMTTHAERDFLVTAIQLGVTAYIVKPFSPTELEDTVRKAWNSASKRSSDRYAALPQHNLIIKVDGKFMPAEVVNISRTGIFIKMPYAEGLKLFGTYELSLELERSGAKQPWVISPLMGKNLRLEADASTQTKINMCKAAFSLSTSSMNKHVEEELVSFLKWLNSQEPDKIQDE